MVNFKQPIDVKIHPTIHADQLQRPFHGLTACKCMLHNERSLISPITTKLGLRNLLLVPTSNSDRYFFTRQCSYIFYCWQIKVNFEYPKITNKLILDDVRVQEAINRVVTEELEANNSNQAVEERIYASKSYHKKQAIKILNNLKAALSSSLIRITGYVLFKVYSYLFMSVMVTEGQLQLIEKAAKRNVPLIFVPLHRSHVDYLLITWVLFNREIPVPIVAAGDNLRMPVFGWLLRGLGGFFIKRKLDNKKIQKDYIYRSILQTYMTEALRRGYNLEFFIEGGRTRTGKPCLPKGGLLSVIVDAFFCGTLDDALIVPVAINYDKLLDGNFIREQLGQNKVPESFWRTVRAIIQVLSTNFGYTRIDFGKPFSLKEFFQSSKLFLPHRIQPLHSDSRASSTGLENNLDSYSTSFNRRLSLSNEHNVDKNCIHPTPSNSSIFGSEVTEDYRQFVKSLGSHILFDAECCQAVMSTNAVAWLLSFLYRNGTTLEILSNSLKLLREDLKMRNRDMGISGNSLHVTIHAVAMLGTSLVSVCGNLEEDPSTVIISPITSIPNIIELSYYANTLMPIYAIDSIVATSLFTMTDCDLPVFSYVDISTDCNLPVSKLVDRAKRLCEILRHEFLLVPPCGYLDSKIQDAIDKLVVSGLLVSEMEKLQSSSKMRYDRSSDEESDESGVSVDVFYSISPKSSNLEMVGMLTCALSPIIDTYYATITNLKNLVGRVTPEKEFVGQIQKQISSMILNGTLQYGESIAADPIRNALKFMEDEHLIESHTQDSIKVLFLNKDKEQENEIFSYIKEIESYRI